MTFAQLMGIELRKKNLKGKTKAERQRLFKEAAAAAKRKFNGKKTTQKRAPAKRKAKTARKPSGKTVARPSQPPPDVQCDEGEPIVGQDGQRLRSARALASTPLLNPRLLLGQPVGVPFRGATRSR